MTTESKTEALDTITKAAGVGPFRDRIKDAAAIAVAHGATQDDIAEAIRAGLPKSFRASAADTAAAEYYAIATDEAAARKDENDTRLREVRQRRTERRKEARYRKLVASDPKPGTDYGIRKVAGNSSYCPRCGGPNSVTGTLCGTCAGDE